MANPKSKIENPKSDAESPARVWLRRVLSVLVLCALAAYVAWWLFHLAHGRLPSAPLRAVTGLPAPTTGCTRSVLRLLKGDLAGSFAFNPFAVPILLLFAASLALLALRLVRRRRFILPSIFLYSWLAVLGLAWAAKLLGSPRYW